MEDKLAEFLSSGSGDGSGSGSGSGYGSDNGFGYGRGYSYSRVFGDDSGGDSVNGYGYGYGDGYCCGAGSGNGHGSGYSNGSEIVRFGGKPVVFVDGIQAVVSNIKENVMSGYILNEDFTKEKCYIVKGNGFFARGKTIKEAREMLVEKFMESMDEDEIFEKFMSEFSSGKKYKGTMFFSWHHYLTGSCLMGRESFVKNHGLDLEKEYTVEEFFDLCRNDYGGKVIQRLEERWNKENGR